ncbi:iron-containing alcohol dehydrogenase [Pseudonocardia sulfidoxydans]|uniref:iron-containing alcohol dehydrogenase n=1 Tax=Pseudonocardia sulfidoxydans TaxID=54011 RepID=UPI001649F670|nr:iron-containing alcohol dehydrogenase [Pseudonocardia sulfidoxydans]
MQGQFVQPRFEQVLFGPGVLHRLGEVCERLGASRVFVVASPSLGRAIALDELLAEASAGRIVDVYTGARPHVPHGVVLDATQAAERCRADAVVSIGGGSPIDLAKAVTFCLARGVRTREELIGQRAADPAAHSGGHRGPLLPHIAISTTLSAGEFTGILGVTDTLRGVKDVYDAPELTPRAILLDPSLARHTPGRLWASTGIKAVDHAVETMCSVNAQPITDALATDSLARMLRHLPPAVADADDLYSRGQCQVASWQSIFGLGNVRMGLSHGLGHQLGGRAGVPHGITSCVLLPAVLEYNSEHSERPQAVVARLLADVLGRPPETGAAELLRCFISSLGLPTRLREVGVHREDFPAFAHEIASDLVASANPRPIEDEADIITVLNRAW